MTLSSTVPLLAAAVAALLAVAAVAGRTRSPGRWIFAAAMAVLAVETFLSRRSATAPTPGGAARWQEWRLLAFALLPGLWSLFSLCYSRGNHAEFLRRWGGWVAFSLIGPLVLAFVFHDDLVIELPPGPAATVYVVGLGWAGKALHVFAMLAWVFVLLNLERTFRTAVGTMRWRIKFAIVGFAVLFGTRLYTSSQAFLYSAVPRTHSVIVACAILLACLLVVASVARARAFEVEVYPSHAILYNSLTIVLAGLYLLGVGVLAKLVEAWGGDGNFPVAAALMLAALVGLGLLALSDRLRMRLRRFVSRHFQRPLHDYRRLWSGFSERTATCVNQPEYCQAVARLVSETFESLSVSVWLVDDARSGLAWGASTVLSAERAAALLARPEATRPVVEALRDETRPVALDTGTEVWREALRQLQPDQFGKGGGRLAMPLRAHGEFLGVITLGDRVSGVPFDGQDLDLLRCLADQTAAGLLNLRLTRRRLESKQLEAFQAMSTFFVHDLKNAASTLALTLENLRVHFDNPAFRQDALGAIGRATDRINGLIQRLAALRQGLELTAHRTDLNAVVQAALQSLGTGFPKVELALADLPPARLDARQMQQVIANFLLNARDAIGEQGHIAVRTARQNGWAVLSVTDDGCGMTPEFLRQQLFRPFQTTKSRGLGIGLFQAKVIVEAHRGRIEVDSAPGRGTTVRVLVPLEADQP